MTPSIDFRFEGVDRALFFVEMGGGPEVSQSFPIAVQCGRPA
jgi:hypothetical protein